jgi:hypothetical protein
MTMAADTAPGHPQHLNPGVLDPTGIHFEEYLHGVASNGGQLADLVRVFQASHVFLLQ